MKLKEGLVLRPLGGKYVAVATGKLTSTFHGMIRLNETGASMMNLLKEDTTKEEVINNLMKEYQADQTEIEKDVDTLLTNLKDNGLLDE
ncbi:MAG: PqqD family protein [Erysipelotrichaceae bacterium]|nr:PqqD family protein [Erysipelotrichaceae bacterium]